MRALVAGVLIDVSDGLLALTLRECTGHSTWTNEATIVSYINHRQSVLKFLSYKMVVSHALQHLLPHS